MKTFFYLSIVCALLLEITLESGLNKKSKAEIKIPWALKGYHMDIQSDFEKTENANLLASFLFGAQKGISPHTKKAFQVNGLGFLLSPSGVHLAGLFFLVGLALKRIKKKWIRRVINIGLLLGAFFLPHYDAIKRLSLLRLMVQANRTCKLKIPFEWIVLLTFIMAFVLGHYFSSPLGFVFSFLYIGTFTLLGDQSKLILLGALLSNQLLLGLFLGTKVSIFSVLASLMGVALFSLLFPLLIVFFATYWAIPINWGEPLINVFVKLIKLSSRLMTGTLTSSSVFLLIAIWALLLCKNIKRRRLLTGLFLLMHTDVAVSPAVL